MTLTRWLLAGLVAVTIGAAAGWAQNCSRPAAGIGTSADGKCAARAPYYNEVADILFPKTEPACPTPCSSPVTWQGVFNAMARCQGEAPARPPRTTLIQMANFYLNTGHYESAVFMAQLACDRNANCTEARQLLARATAARNRHHVEDHEACEGPAAPGKKKCCCDKARGCGDCKDCCCTKACGTCAVDCGCNKEGGCGADCQCGLTGPPMPPVQGCVCPGVPGNGNHLIRITTKHFEAVCDSLFAVPAETDRVLLQGRACVIFHKADRPGRIIAERILLNLKDGSYEIPPAPVRCDPAAVPAGFWLPGLGGERFRY